MAYKAVQHTLPAGMQPVVQTTSPGSQLPDWRSIRPGFDDTSGRVTRLSMARPPRRAWAVSWATSILWDY